MKKIAILYFLVQAFILQAEELPWFEINCNLRNADYILMGKILDDNGKIAVIQDYSRKKIHHKEIIIEEFGAAENFAIKPFYESLVGHSIILFVKFDSIEERLKPAFWGWELSTLWIEGESLKGVIQPENPGGWELMIFYKDIIALEVQIDNWDILNEAFWSFIKYDKKEDRLHYLCTIFKWHPFKVEIIREIKKEKEFAPKYLKYIMWELYRQNLPTKAELCECGWIDWQENIYQEIFSAFKEATVSNYENDFSDFVNALKHSINNMEYKRSEELNENFIIEFLSFLNSNPTDGWVDEKITLRRIVDDNSEFYNDMFVRELREKLK